MTPKPLSLETERDHEQWKVVVCFLIRWIYRTWMACVLLVAVFTVLWSFEAAGVITRGMLSAVWIGIIAIGIAFLALLIPVAILTYRNSSE